MRLQDWQQRFPGRIESMFNALGRVVPSHLMDRDLYDFAEAPGTVAAAAASAAGTADATDGESAFGQDEFVPRQVIQLHPLSAATTAPTAATTAPPVSPGML